MKYRNKSLNKPEAHHEPHHEPHQEIVEVMETVEVLEVLEVLEVADFHNQRMLRELKIETKKESSIKPEGNYEYEQLVAEEADFNAKPMIEEAAFFIAQGRGFAPGQELSDWLQAETEVECLLRTTH